MAAARPGPPHQHCTPAPSSASSRRGAICSPVAVAQLKIGGLLAGLGGVVVTHHPAGQLHAGEGRGRKGQRLVSWAYGGNGNAGKAHAGPVPYPPYHPSRHSRHSRRSTALATLTVAFRLVQPSGWKPMLPRCLAQQMSYEGKALKPRPHTAASVEMPQERMG